jgi:hypothetical protein
MFNFPIYTLQLSNTLTIKKMLFIRYKKLIEKLCHNKNYLQLNVLYRYLDIFGTDCQNYCKHVLKYPFLV